MDARFYASMACVFIHVCTLYMYMLLSMSEYKHSYSNAKVSMSTSTSVTNPSCDITLYTVTGWADARFYASMVCVFTCMYSVHAFKYE